MSTATELDTQALVERFTLKAFVESCLVLEEGVATIRDIDLAMMTGFGILPGPFARADATGLDEVLASLERAQSEWGDAFEPPLILRRLVAQGRLGQKTGQGFFPYARPDDGFDQHQAQCENIAPRSRRTKASAKLLGRTIAGREGLQGRARLLEGFAQAF